MSADLCQPCTRGDHWHYTHTARYARTAGQWVLVACQCPTCAAQDALW